MLSTELTKKVRLIEITTRKTVTDVMSGRYRSHFKGHGMQFSEHRLYVPGDDVRHIDWKVSARTRDPLIKKFEEERELTVFLVVDVSKSNQFGSSSRLKSEVLAEIGAMLAYAAVHTGDKVGVLLFAGEVEQIIPPKKGRQQIQRIIRDLLTYQPKTNGTDLASALNSAARMMKSGGIVFVLSDFIAEGFEIPIKRLAKRHDVVAVSIQDPRESQIGISGTIRMTDPETGKECFVDTRSYVFKKWLKEIETERESSSNQMFKGGKIEHLRIQTQDDYGEAVVRFFRTRSRGNR